VRPLVIRGDDQTRVYMSSRDYNNIIEPIRPLITNLNKPPVTGSRVAVDTVESGCILHCAAVAPLAYIEKVN
jgi:hypothetical protein